MKIIILRFPEVDPLFSEVVCFMAERLGYDIVGFVSFDVNEKLKTFNGYLIYEMMQVYDLSWDVAIYACEEDFFETIRPRLIKLQIGTDDQFKNINWLLQQTMIKKYEDFDEPTIQATLEYWKTHKISVYNQLIDKNNIELDKVFFDEACGLPYINFKTVGGNFRRMYFPNDYDFLTVDGQKAVANLLCEQRPTSPHLYIKDEHKVNAGDIIIDAGTCEGNFALRYVDICSKLYLFEPNKKWQEPLRQTFKDYRDKVKIIPRFVSDKTGGENITIDDVLLDMKCENIFLKMDVEGAEPKALRGAEKILTNNKVKASVCTYHNFDDLVKVKSILQKFGYKTSTSAGYMVFLYDPNIFVTADFRKGIVYAEK